MSHTEGLLGVAERIYRANGLHVEIIRPVDYEIAAGLEKNYTGKDGYLRDEWPMLHSTVAFTSRITFLKSGFSF